jgi:alpha-tubulin suppressor-like RCC1 family protein
MLPFPIVSNTNQILPRSIKKIEASTEAAFILFESGNLYAFGVNTLQQFGTGTTSGSTYKNWTLINTSVLDVYAGVDSVIVQLSSGVWQYAGNTKTAGTGTSDVGVGNWTVLPGMQYFVNNGLTPKKIQIGGTNIAVLCTNDTLYQMGYNSTGVFGTGSATNSTTFVVSRTNVSNFVCGHLTALCTDKTSGILYKAGWNNNAQLGAPTSTQTFPSWTSVGVTPTAFFASRYSTSYITTAGTIFSTGARVYGQIPGATSASDATLITSYTSLGTGLPAGSLASYTAINHTKTWATWLNTLVGLYCTGRNDSGQLGIGNTTFTSQYVRVPLPSDIQPSEIESWQMSIYFSLMLKNDGRTLYVAGSGTYFPQYTGIQSSFVKLTLPE